MDTQSTVGNGATLAEVMAETAAKRDRLIGGIVGHIGDLSTQEIERLHPLVFKYCVDRLFAGVDAAKSKARASKSNGKAITLVRTSGKGKGKAR